MGCEAGQCKTATPGGIFIVTPSLKGSPTKAKEAPSPHEVKLVLLDTNPVFQCLGENVSIFEGSEHGWTFPVFVGLRQQGCWQAF